MPAASSTDASAATTHPLRTAWLLVGLGVLLRWVLATAVPLLPDEAYYWEWSRRLAPGYFDHPPGIAYLIALGTALLGATPAGVRFGPAIAGLLTVLGILTLTRNVAAPGDAPVAMRRAALLALVLPVASLGLVLATPDAPLLLAVVAALLAFDRVIVAERGWRALGWWAVCGAAVGTAFVAKYMGVLIGGSIAAAVVVHPRLRAQLRRPGPYVAAIVSVLVFSPVVLWNALEDWVSFRFQLGHGFGGGGRGSILTRELELVGGQLAIATPVLAVLLALAAWRDWRSPRAAAVVDPLRATRRFALATAVVLPAVFFVVSALRKPVEANWLALCYVPAIALLASHQAPFARGRWYRGGVTFAGVVLAIAVGALFVPGSPLKRNRQLAELGGWPRLADAASRAVADPYLAGTVDRWIAANRYQDAAQLAFHVAGHPNVFALNLASRPNQYDLWQRSTAMNATPPRLRQGDGLVAVFETGTKGDSLARVVAGWFADARPAGRVSLTGTDDPRGARQLWMYRLYRGRPDDAEGAR
ncbi:MAG: glycosyltransferase family 39 protein [Gemmatimonadaceae bacterium]|nr:glycosyltransferase family 39 protein [Gemmatimonadaceae bacterium]